MKKVKLYSTPTCGYCVQLKDWFRERNIEYQEFNVQIDDEARDFIIRKSGQMGVPVTIISDGDEDDGQLVLGFDTEKISNLLGI